LLFIIPRSALITVFLLFTASIAFAGASAAEAGSSRGQAVALQSPAPKQGLNFVLGAHGLDSLSFNGQSLLASRESGELQPHKSVFRAVLEALLPGSSSRVVTPDKPADTVDLSYPWGRVSCAYGQQGDRITMKITVSNASAKAIDQLSLRLIELNFPSVPKGGTLEAGMFGFGFKGPDWLLPEWPPSIPTVADPRFVVPIVHVDYGIGALNFCSDDVECAVDVQSSTDSAKTSYPLVITCHDIKPGVTKMFNFSLRFGPAGARVQDLSGDVLERYARKYPFQVNWEDHRPIGAIFLAGPQINVSSKPRRWTVNFSEVDVSNDKGKAALRATLLKLADNSVQVLKDTGAQGMITWDPEGEEFPGACYYGDPRLVPRFAPEMEFKVNGGKSAIDEYFEKFRVAGLRVGVCIRPQDVKMVDGKPVHQAADDEQAVQILRKKIVYAKERWGLHTFLCRFDRYGGSSVLSGRF
jgi:hypothetical protein